MKKLYHVVTVLFIAVVMAGCNGVNVKITSIDVHMEGANVITPDDTSLITETEMDSEGELQTDIAP